MCQYALPFEINKNICKPLGYYGKASPKVPVSKQEELWTTECVIDELHCQSENFRDRDYDKKYEAQSKRLSYKIPIFIVNKTDLSFGLLKDLSLAKDEKEAY